MAGSSGTTSSAGPAEERAATADSADTDDVARPERETVVGDPIDADVDADSHVVVVGYDAWTEPVLEALEALDVSVSLITREDVIADRLEDRSLSVVDTDDVDEACFFDAGIERADAVLVATLDDQLNVLAVLTVMNVDASMRVVTFAGEAQDVPKLRAAGADRVVSLGQAVGELLVEVALSERRVADVVSELVGDAS